MSGVTRDRQYGVADWNGKDFNVIDTGGFVSGSEDIFEKEIAQTGTDCRRRSQCYYLYGGCAYRYDGS